MKNPVTDQWVSAAPMPTPLSGQSVVSLGIHIYLFGGTISDEPPELNSEVWRYHPGADEWERFSSMPTPRHGMATTVYQGRIYLMGGGEGPGFVPSNANEVLVISN
jgi:N-acetylneuraminic acid mutarotase